MANEAVELFCDKIDEWADLLLKNEEHERFAPAWEIVRLYIDKSCLLSRTLYGKEKPSQTPCPVHKGRWSGCHWHDGPMAFDEPATAREGKIVLIRAFDLGCRCYFHKCGCTTGWQIDRNCGCLDENGCFTLPDGSCVSPVECIHSVKKGS